MRIAVSLDEDERPHIVELFAAALPDAEVFDATSAHVQADYAVCGRRDETLFDLQRELKAVFAFSAGVGYLLALPNLPTHVPLIRLEDAGMAAQMVRYVLAAALRVLTRQDVYARQQREGRWEQHAPRGPETLAAGVLGQGVIGTQVARALTAQGFRVRGYGRTRRAEAGIACYAGDAELAAFLTGLDLLVAVAPLTPATRGILNQRTLALLAEGAHVVNIGRGALVVDADLIALLDEGRLGGATLDVFEVEPLPPGHPYWSRPEIAVTPHVAGLTLPDEAVAQIVAKMKRLERGLPVTGVVDRARGY